MVDKSKKILNCISSYRKKRGLTQQEFADKLKISLSTIRRIEMGGEGARIGTMTRIADALNITLDQLLQPEKNLATIEFAESIDGYCYYNPPVADVNTKRFEAGFQRTSRPIVRQNTPGCSKWIKRNCRVDLHIHYGACYFCDWYNEIVH